MVVWRRGRSSKSPLRPHLEKGTEKKGSPYLLSVYLLKGKEVKDGCKIRMSIPSLGVVRYMKIILTSFRWACTSVYRLADLSQALPGIRN